MWIFFSISLFLTGLLGAYISKQINTCNLTIWATLIPSIISGSIWGWLIKKPNVNLTFATVLFDVIYTASFVTGFILLGDKITLIQTIGLLVSIVGIILMSI